MDWTVTEEMIESASPYEEKMGLNEAWRIGASWYRDTMTPRIEAAIAAARKQGIEEALRPISNGENESIWYNGSIDFANQIMASRLAKLLPPPPDPRRAKAIEAAVGKAVQVGWIFNEPAYRLPETLEQMGKIVDAVIAAMEGEDGK